MFVSAGRIVAAQLTEVGARVAEVREFAARECAALVARAAAATPGPASKEVLYAAAFVLAEYCRYALPTLLCKSL